MQFVLPPCKLILSIIWRDTMIRYFILSCLILALNSTAIALDSQQLTFFNTKQMQSWGTPKALPPGAHDLVLNGNVAEPGVYTVRIKLPANYQIPPYSQSAPSYITVIAGSYHIGIGNTFDKTKGETITTGGFAILPANVPLYTWTTEASIIQIHGEGPVKVSLIKPTN